MKNFLTLLAFVVWITSVVAIEGKPYKFEYITTENGLSQSTVESIFQDSKGYIWIGTRDGLNKYDGKSFEIFRHNNKDTNSIGEGWVNSVCEDHLGNIWIGTNSGISIYNTEKGKTRRLSKEVPGGDGKVASIVLGPDNKIWYGLTGAYKLVSYDLEKDEYKVYDYESVNTSNSAGIFDILFAKSGKMYLASESDELLEFDRQAEVFIAHNYLLSFEGRNYKKNIVENENGELYIGAERAGVHIYNPSTGNSRAIEGINNNIVKSRVLCVSPTEVWIGTDGGGINIYDPTTESITLLQSDNSTEQSLGENTVFNMLQDRDGNIWVGHYGAGVSIWKKYKEKFLTFKNNPFDPTSISNHVVTAIFEDSLGRLWIGQDGGGLSLYNPIENNFTHYWHEEGNPTSLTSNVIIAIEENRDGHLILATYDGGLMTFDPETGQVVKAFGEEDGLSGPNIWEIYNDNQGRHWLAMLGIGVDIYDPITDTITPIPDPGSNVVMKILEAPDGMIWMGTENTGISVVDPEDYSHYMLNTSEESKYQLSGNDVKSIIFCNNCAWIGSVGGGLDKINFSNDSVQNFSTETGLSSNSIMSILQDDSGNLWLSSTNGLMKFNPITTEVVVYDKAQGTQGNEYKYNAECQLRNGFMAFGGSGGFSIFHPDSIKDSPIIPALVITDFKLYNESATIGEEESVLQKHISVTDRVVLKHKHKVFSFEFAALDYTAPNKNLYRYKLEGYDEEWIEAGNKNYANYTNVSPGRYSFMLMGSNSDGVWSDEVVEVKLRVKPPFYKTKLFILLIIVLTVYLVNFFVKERIKQNKRDKEVLQQKIEEGKKELNTRIQEIEDQKSEIRTREENEKELRFTNTGIVKLSNIISQDRDNISKLSNDVISALTEYIEANAGVIYLIDTNSNNEVNLYPEAMYCYDTEKKEDLKILPGEGYVGTSYSSKEVLYVDDMPDGKVVLRSGLGEYSIKNIVFIPIINDDDCLGIFELASITKLEAYKIDFVTKIADSLGSVLAIEKANRTTKVMLEQNLQQSEELKAQEEELRQNLEEMHATQEEFQRQLDSVDEMQAELDEAKKTIKEFREKK